MFSTCNVTNPVVWFDHDPLTSTSNEETFSRNSEADAILVNNILGTRCIVICVGSSNLLAWCVSRRVRVKYYKWEMGNLRTNVRSLSSWIVAWRIIDLFLSLDNFHDTNAGAKLTIIERYKTEAHSRNPISPER